MRSVVSTNDPGRATRGGGRSTPDGFLFELSGGHPALDLTNTVDLRPSAEPRELLPDYEALIAWSEQSGIVDHPLARSLRARAQRQPRRARAVLQRTRHLRKALFGLFSAAASGRPLPSEALDILNAERTAAAAHLRLEREGRHASWRWSDEESLERVLWPVAHAAAELLASPRLERVRQCQAEGCAWLFLDLSKNRSRRWCDMAVCGNRSKVRRFRAARRRRARLPRRQEGLGVGATRH